MHASRRRQDNTPVCTCNLQSNGVERDSLQGYAVVNAGMEEQELARRHLGLISALATAANTSQKLEMAERNLDKEMKNTPKY